MSQKDYFSGHARIYAAFRPTYPRELYNFIFSHLASRETAWDCATGNGQVAQYLCKSFKTVYATDISEKQLQEAIRASNIIYSVSKAEQTPFTENQFDLITVAQAIHWFKVEDFYHEVNRTLKPGGLLAVWGYALLNVEPLIDELFLDFYYNTVGPYWDEARKMVENEYRDLSFPFDQIEAPAFAIHADWTRDHFAGYLTSWSATQKFIREHHYNPVDKLMPEINRLWNEHEVRRIAFPVFLKLGNKP